MFKPVLTLSLSMLLLTGCSMSSIPFMGSSKPVINLDSENIDQKSYAVAYSATLQTYQDRVKSDYDVNSFASGANDWYLGRILVPVDQIKQRLYNGGHDSQVFAYYSGVVFAADLQTNFSRLSQNCWTHIQTPSMTQGIYDAMLDLQQGKTKAEDDEYLVQGSEQLLKACQK